MWVEDGNGIRTHARPASTRSTHKRVLLDPLHGLVAVLLVLVLAIAAACVALRSVARNNFEDFQDSCRQNIRTTRIY